MDPATAQLIVSSVIRVLDHVSRVAEKKFDSREELEAYIAERNELRERLVGLAQAIVEEAEARQAEPEPPEEDEDDDPVGPEHFHPREEDDDATEAAPQPE